MRPNPVLFMARGLLLLLGLCLLTAAGTAEWTGLVAHHGWGMKRRLLALLGGVLISMGFLLQSGALRRWLLRHTADRLLSSSQLALVLVARLLIWVIAITLLTVAIGGSLCGMDAAVGWDRLQTLEFFLGLVFLMIAIYLHRLGWQRWLVRRLGMRFWTPVQVAGIIAVRVILAASGIACTLLVSLADWLGLDPTPGWGYTRKLQFAAGLTMLLAGFLLYDRSIQIWLIRSFGRAFLGTLHSVVTWMTRGVLGITGLVTTILVIGADWFGLDPTPGWGGTRRLELAVGLLLMLASVLVHNRSLRQWGYRHLGLKVVSPVQVAILLVMRLLLGVLGVVIVVLAIGAGWWSGDPSPGWGEGRFIQLAAGLALIAASFISHHASLLKWQMRKLYEP